MAQEELWLNGDLQTMAAQRSVASSLDCSLRQKDVYPIVVGEQSIRLALTAFYNRKTTGWDSYRKKMVTLGICSEADAQKALKRQRSV